MPQTISQGATGSAVSEAQYLLSRMIQEPAAVDGIFGQQTINAVKRYQQIFDVAVNGVVDQETWRSLLTVFSIPPTLAPGSHGPLVRRLQRAIDELISGPPFHFLTENGTFGPETESLVKQFSDGARSRSSSGRCRRAADVGEHPLI